MTAAKQLLVLQNQNLKKCTKCGLAKAYSDFHKRKNRPHGASACKKCAHERRKISGRNLEKSRAYDRKRYWGILKDAKKTNPKVKEQYRIYQRNHRKKFPEKMRARWAIANAIKAKTITRQPCEICFGNKSEAHHIDYAHPFLVKWLCRVCHLKEHSIAK